MATLIDATNRLAELRKLPNGWDYGAGGPISTIAFLSGALLLQYMSKLGVKEFDVVPGTDDGAIVVAYHLDKSAEIHCLSDGNFDLLHEVDDADDVFRDNLSFVDLISILGEFGWKSRRSFVSCTRNVICRESDGSPASPSKIPVVAGFRLSAPVVSPKKVASHANTFANSTTKKFAENRQSSGEYRSLPFQRAIA